MTKSRQTIPVEERNNGIGEGESMSNIWQNGMMGLVVGDALGMPVQFVDRSELKKNPEILPYMIMITDGKGNVSLDKEKKPKNELLEICEKIRNFPYINTMVLDIERKGVMSFGIAKEMAKRMGANYQKIETLKSSAIISAIERVREQ